MKTNDIIIICIVVALVAAVIIALTSEGGPVGPEPGTMHFEANKVECMNNQRNIVGLLTVQQEFPKASGATFVLWAVKRGELDSDDELKILFCPGDRNESYRDAGEADAYRHLDLKRPDSYGHLTSYAGRDQLDPKCAARIGSSKSVVLTCDDSEDHHHNAGIVVGMSSGAVRWRDKVDDWQLDEDAYLKVGKGSVIEELTCMVAD